jgi:hypothetical protein
MRRHLILRTVKTAALYLAPIESNSKNTHPPFALKPALLSIQSIARENILLCDDPLMKFYLF